VPSFGPAAWYVTKRFNPDPWGVDRKSGWGKGGGPSVVLVPQGVRTANEKGPVGPALEKKTKGGGLCIPTSRITAKN